MRLLVEFYSFIYFDRQIEIKDTKKRRCNLSTQDLYRKNLRKYRNVNKGPK